MIRIFFSLLLLQSLVINAQDFAVRTNDIVLDFRKPEPTSPKGLPMVSWKSPLMESSISPFPSYIVEAFVSSDTELKSVSLVYSNGNVTIGEKSYDVKQLREKKVRQKLTLNDGRNVVEIIVENMDGDKVIGTRSLILGEFTLNKEENTSSGKIVVKRMELEKDKLNLYYDLVDSVNSNKYTISLYSSKDNYTMKQENVSGKIGLEIKPGTNHKMTWNAKEMLGADFNGKIKLELRAKLFVPFLRFDALKKSYKRGKDVTVTWKGSITSTALNFDLYRGNLLVHAFANFSNVGKTTFTIPSSIKPGKGYYLKVSDVINNDQVVVSETFKVKRRTPLFLKILPIAVIGGAAAVLGGGNSSNSAHAIPDPLSPTTIH